MTLLASTAAGVTGPVRYGLRGSGGRAQGDLVTEGLELTDEVTGTIVSGIEGGSLVETWISRSQSARTTLRDRRARAAGSRSDGGLGGDLS